MSFTNKVVVVTGAGGGMGTAVIKKFTDQGAKAALLDIDESLCRRTAGGGEKSRHHREILPGGGTLCRLAEGPEGGPGAGAGLQGGAVRPEGSCRGQWRRGRAEPFF